MLIYLVLVVLAVASVFVVGNTTVDTNMCMYIYSVKLFAKLSQHKCKYPQAIGAIYGSRIPTNAPLDSKADYLCRKVL